MSKSGIVVEVRGGNLEKAMRVLKKKVMKEGLVKELRARQYYQKPSEIKREKKKEGIKNYKKNKKKMEQEQIEDAFCEGVDDEYEHHINNKLRKNSEQYYNETFKNK